MSIPFFMFNAPLAVKTFRLTTYFTKYIKYRVSAQYYILQKRKIYEPVFECFPATFIHSLQLWLGSRSGVYGHAYLGTRCDSWVVVVLQNGCSRDICM